jgi:hypothetical protein
VSLFLLFVFSFSIVELFPWCGIFCLSFNNYSYFTPISFVWSSCFIYLICIYLCILVSNTFSISDVVRVVPPVFSLQILIGGDFRIIEGEKIRSRVGRPPVCSV